MCELIKQKLIINFVLPLNYVGVLERKEDREKHVVVHIMMLDIDQKAHRCITQQLHQLSIMIFEVPNVIFMIKK